MDERGSEGADRPVGQRGGLTRRSFLEAFGGFGVGFLPGGAALTVVACGGSSDTMMGAAPAGTAAPGVDVAVLENPTTMTMSIEERQVQWVIGKSPAEANAWVYTASGVTPASGVLGNALGPFFKVRRDMPCTVTWTNTIGASIREPARLASPPINVPLDLGQCGRVRTQSSVGLAVHLHGARVQPAADGGPLTPISFAGNPYGFAQSQQDFYPNAQRGTLLWYHDHAMDRVGRHLYAGLAGAYCIRDGADDAILALIGGRSQELLCAVQDRLLSADETRLDYDAGIPHDPSTSLIGSDDAVGRPEFLGRSIFVNGHPAPDLGLTRRTWRLRLLNVSNARTYALALCDPDAIAAGSGRVWYTDRIRLIGADGGLIGASVPLQPNDALVIASAQRRDVLVDLSGLPASVQRLHLVNLSLRYLLAVDAQTLEAIYTTFYDSVLAPTSETFSADDQILYDALEHPLAIVARVTLGVLPAPGAALPAPSAAAIDKILADAADGDDFAWDGTRMGPLAGVPVGPNRLVLLISNTLRIEINRTVNARQRLRRRPDLRDGLGRRGLAVAVRGRPRHDLEPGRRRRRRTTSSPGTASSPRSSTPTSSWPRPTRRCMRRRSAPRRGPTSAGTSQLDDLVSWRPTRSKVQRRRCGFREAAVVAESLPHPRARGHVHDVALPRRRLAAVAPPRRPQLPTSPCRIA